MANIYSVSLGCPKNRVDTERLVASVPDAALVERLEDADCILINTCAFIAPAVQESVRAILDAASGRAELAGPHKPLLVVAGCLVGRYGAAELSPELQEVDLWLDNRELAAWPQKLNRALAERAARETPAGETAAGTPARAKARPGKKVARLRMLSTGPSYAWLKISDGCDHACSFCTIPSIRGRFSSTPAPELEREARELLDAGVSELVLVAQDTTAWGKDLEQNLMGLLDQLLPLPGLERLRLMYLYPAGLSHELLRFLRGAGKPFVPYFDIPVQHAHSGILSRMGRPFARDPRAALDRVREYFPEAAMRTSLIVGFPGETDEQFQELADFVRQARFTHLGVFAYQAEDGTKAGAMRGQVPDKVKQWRRDSLMMLQGEISEEILAGYVGQRLDILVDAPHPEWPGLFTGRAWFQAPESDGVTYVSGPGVEAGKIVNAEIMESQTYDLVALA